jgi:fumarate hydratase subunit alpha
LPKGFGSENKTTLKMFNPTVTTAEIENFIVDSVEKAGPEGCPPFIVGVGIGGTSDYALLLAKRALLERIDTPNPDIFLSNLEKRLFKKINALNIGPMGLGGRCTALAVKIKTAPTHIAGLPVGVNISCHALRSASISIR